MDPILVGMLSVLCVYLGVVITLYWTQTRAKDQKESGVTDRDTGAPKLPSPVVEFFDNLDKLPKGEGVHLVGISKKKSPGPRLIEAMERLAKQAEGKQTLHDHEDVKKELLAEDSFNPNTQWKCPECGTVCDQPIDKYGPFVIYSFNPCCRAHATQQHAQHTAHLREIGYLDDD